MSITHNSDSLNHEDLERDLRVPLAHENGALPSVVFRNSVLSLDSSSTSVSSSAAEGLVEYHTHEPVAGHTTALHHATAMHHTTAVLQTSTMHHNSHSDALQRHHHTQTDSFSQQVTQSRALTGHADSLSIHGSEELHPDSGFSTSDTLVHYSEAVEEGAVETVNIRSDAAIVEYTGGMQDGSSELSSYSTQTGADHYTVTSRPGSSTRMVSYADVAHSESSAGLSQFTDGRDGLTITTFPLLTETNLVNLGELGDGLGLDTSSLEASNVLLRSDFGASDSGGAGIAEHGASLGMIDARERRDATAMTEENIVYLANTDGSLSNISLQISGVGGQTMTEPLSSLLTSSNGLTLLQQLGIVRLEGDQNAIFIPQYSTDVVGNNTSVGVPSGAIHIPDVQQQELQQQPQLQQQQLIFTLDNDFLLGSGNSSDGSLPQYIIAPTTTNASVSFSHNNNRSAAGRPTASSITMGSSSATSASKPITRVLGSGPLAISAQGIVQQVVGTKPAQGIVHQVGGRRVTVLPRPEDLQRLKDQKALVVDLPDKRTMSMQRRRGPVPVRPHQRYGRARGGRRGRPSLQRPVEEDDQPSPSHVPILRGGVRKRGRRGRRSRGRRGAGYGGRGRGAGGDVMVVSSTGKRPGRPKKAITLLDGTQGARMIHTGPPTSKIVAADGSGIIVSAFNTEVTSDGYVTTEWAGLPVPAAEVMPSAVHETDSSRRRLPPRNRGNKYSKMIEALIRPDDEIPSESSDDDPDFSERLNKGISKPAVLHRTGKRGRPRKHPRPSSPIIRLMVTSGRPSAASNHHHATTTAMSLSCHRISVTTGISERGRPAGAVYHGYGNHVTIARNNQSRSGGNQDTGIDGYSRDICTGSAVVGRTSYIRTKGSRILNDVHGSVSNSTNGVPEAMEDELLHTRHLTLSADSNGGFTLMEAVLPIANTVVSNSQYTHHPSSRAYTTATIHSSSSSSSSFPSITVEGGTAAAEGIIAEHLEMQNIIITRLDDFSLVSEVLKEEVKDERYPYQQQDQQRQCRDDGGQDECHTGQQHDALTGGVLDTSSYHNHHSQVQNSGAADSVSDFVSTNHQPLNNFDPNGNFDLRNSPQLSLKDDIDREGNAEHDSPSPMSIVLGDTDGNDMSSSGRVHGTVGISLLPGEEKPGMAADQVEGGYHQRSYSMDLSGGWEEEERIGDRAAVAVGRDGAEFTGCGIKCEPHAEHLNLTAAAAEDDYDLRMVPCVKSDGTDGRPGIYLDATRGLLQGVWGGEEVAGGCKDDGDGRSCTQERFIEESSVIVIKEEPLDTNGHKCEACGEVVPFMRDFIRHLRSRHNLRPYECQECGKTFTSVAALQDHEVVHSLETPFRCTVCGLNFEKHATLKLHQKQHADELKFSCDMCGKHLTNQSQLRKHLMTHKENVAYACELCGKLFGSKESHVIHMKNHKKERPHVCDICNIGFFSSGGLNRHRKVHKRNEGVDSILDLRCSYCHSNFSYEASLKKHLSFVHNIGPVQVKNERVTLPLSEDRVVEELQEQLNEGYAPKNSELYDVPGASETLESKFPVDPFRCGICEESFTDVDIMCEHFTMCHTGEQKLYCDTCGAGCSTDDQMERHKNVHVAEEQHTLIQKDSKDLPYVCQLCGKNYKTVQELTKHGRLHNVEKPYKCTICTASFPIKSALDKHILVHTGERPFKCDVCLKSFRQSAALVRHKLWTHRLKNQNKCEICGKTFFTAALLIYHLDVHGEQGKNLKIKLKEIETLESVMEPNEEEDDSKPIDMNEENARLKNINNKCEYCPMSFPSYVTLLTHKLTHKLSASYKCDKCHRTFREKRYLQKHKMTHRGVRSWECDICRKCFAAKLTLIRHSQVHLREALRPSMECQDGVEGAHVCTLPTVLRCNECNIKYTHKSHYVRHKLLHSGTPLLKCGLCDKMFVHKSDIIRHKVMHSFMFTCDICNRNFHKRSLYMMHKRKHLDDKPFKCLVCEKSFSSSSNFNAHRRIHSGDKPFKCDQCEYRCAQSGRLMKHKRMHSGDKPYLCQTCGKCFANAESLKVHQRLHTGDRPFKCEHCSKAFINSGSLSQHLRDHIKEDLYKCDLCLHKFRRENHLTKHKMYHDSLTSIPLYMCDICGRVFEKKKYLYTHGNVHNRQKNYTCGKCNKQLASRLALKNHEHIHAGLMPYKCSICDKTFRSGSNLKRHMRVHEGHPRCSDCGDTFVNTDELEQHSHMHLVMVGDDDSEDQTAAATSSHAQLYVFEPMPDSIDSSQPLLVNSSQQQHLFVDGPQSLLVFPENTDTQFSDLPTVNRDSIENSHHHHNQHHQQQHHQHHHLSNDMDELSIANSLTSQHHHQVVTQVVHQLEPPSGSSHALPSEDMEIDVHHDSLVEAADSNQEMDPKISITDSQMDGLDDVSEGTDQSHFIVPEFDMEQVDDNEQSYAQPATPVKTHQCTVCSKTFAKKQYLTKHMYRHREVKPHGCDVCGKRFAQKFEVVVHKIKHTGEKPYTCDFCQKQFRSKVNLNNHKMRHNGEFPFLCSICRKGFSTQLQLERHVTLHTGTLPFTCHLCNKGYSIRLNLMKHLARAHNQTVEQQQSAEEGGETVQSSVDESRDHDTEQLGGDQQLQRQDMESSVQLIQDDLVLSHHHHDPLEASVSGGLQGHSYKVAEVGQITIRSERDLMEDFTATQSIMLFPKVSSEQQQKPCVVMQATDGGQPRQAVTFEVSSNKSTVELLQRLPRQQLRSEEHQFSSNRNNSLPEHVDVYTSCVTTNNPQQHQQVIQIRKLSSDLSINNAPITLSVVQPKFQQQQQQPRHRIVVSQSQEIHHQPRQQQQHLIQRQQRQPNDNTTSITVLDEASASTFLKDVLKVMPGHIVSSGEVDPQFLQALVQQQQLQRQFKNKTASSSVNSIQQVSTDVVSSDQYMRNSGRTLVGTSSKVTCSEADDRRSQVDYVKVVRGSHHHSDDGGSHIVNLSGHVEVLHTGERINVEKISVAGSDGEDEDEHIISVAGDDLA